MADKTSEFRYALQPYKTIKDRYTCPECKKVKKFARYIDKATGDQLADHVGKCERSDNCGYHLTPAKFFAANGITPDHNTDVADWKKPEPRAVHVFKREVVDKSLTGYDKNHFITFLRSRFTDDQVNTVIEKYLIGSSRYWKGSTIFWQVDEQGRVKAGKIMLYDSETGKRVKKPHSYISWVHKALKIETFNMEQCLFGQHLLKDKKQIVAVVESEKTAIIASIYLPQFTWVASGNKGGLSVDKCNALKGHEVILFPDLNAYKPWKQTAELYKFRISDLLERKATEEEREQNLDIGDYLLKASPAAFQQGEPQPMQEEPQSPEGFSPKIIPLHKKFSEAEAAGKFDNHPLRDRIRYLWEGVWMYRHQPTYCETYINQLLEIQF